jgi:hypothetical protein
MLIAPSELLEASPNMSTLETLVLGRGGAVIGEAEEPEAGLGVSTTIRSGDKEGGVRRLPGRGLRRDEERDRASATRVWDFASDDLSSSELDATAVRLRALLLPL